MAGLAAARMSDRQPVAITAVCIAICKQCGRAVKIGRLKLSTS